MYSDKGTDYSYDYEKNCNYHPLNNDPVPILFAISFFLLLIIAGVYLNKSSQVTYNPQQSYFNIVNHGYDNNIGGWIIGVRDKNNVKIGSFSCANKPKKTTSSLIYQATKVTGFFGNVQYKYSFYYVENCYKVGKSMPYQRKKGEFIL